MQLSDRVKNLRACLIVRVSPSNIFCTNEYQLRIYDQSTSEKNRRRRQAGNAEQTAQTGHSVTTDASMSWLTSIDPSVDPKERSLRSQQVNRGSERRRRRSTSCPPVLSESSISVDCLRENVGGLRKHHCQGLYLFSIKRDIS